MLTSTGSLNKAFLSHKTFIIDDFTNKNVSIYQMKEKREKSHEEMQKAQSRRQLEQAKQANIEKLVSSDMTVNVLLFQIPFSYYSYLKLWLEGAACFTLIVLLVCVLCLCPHVVVS